MEEKSYKSWTISDEFRNEVKDAIPDATGKGEPNKTYRHKPGQGRKPLPARKVLEGVLYVLRTGCQWKAVPKEYGFGSSLHRYFQKWREAGFFRKIWAIRLGLAKRRRAYGKSAVYGLIRKRSEFYYGEHSPLLLFSYHSGLSALSLVTFRGHFQLCRRTDTGIIL
ncbi:MAG: transposase [Oscillospiraceae bacterium]|nr:transposase [Oscillospiraceae bacterium]